MRCKRIQASATVAASAAVLTAGLAANGTTIIPISQERFTSTEVLPGCDGLADGEQAMGFDPFESHLETFQQCGNGYGHVSAEQMSQIGTSSVSAWGISFTKNAGVGFSFDLSKLGDLDGDGTIGVADLLAQLAAWGPCAACDTPQACPADLDDDCTVGVSDL